MITKYFCLHAFKCVPWQGQKMKYYFIIVLNFFLLLFYQINAYFVFVVDYRGSFRGRCLIKDEAQSICRIWNWLLSSERCCLYLKGGLEKSPEWLKREIIPPSCILVWNTWKSWSSIKSHLLLVPYFSQPFNWRAQSKNDPLIFRPFLKVFRSSWQLLLNTFKNGRKIKGSFLLWAFQLQLWGVGIFCTYL